MTIFPKMDEKSALDFATLQAVNKGLGLEFSMEILKKGGEIMRYSMFEKWSVHIVDAKMGKKS